MANTVRTINDFKSKLAGGGARPNLFEVSIPNLPDAAKNSSPAATLNNETFQFLCKATNMPASNVASIDVPFRGRIFKVAGDRTIDNWSVTVINDEDFTLRNAFEAWMNAIAKLDNNTGATNPGSYMTDAFVTQLGRGGKERNSKKNQSGNSASALKTYKFVDIFPVNVSAIDLSYDSSDTIEEFTVEFAVQSFEAGDPKDLAGQILK